MDRGLYLSTIALLLFSVVAVYSLSIFSTIYFDASKYIFVKRQLISAVIAIFVMSIVARMNTYNVFNPLGFLLFISSFLAIILMLFLPETFVKAVLGAKRWIKIGGFSIAPTEFFKYGFVFFVSWSLARKIKELNSNSGVFKEFALTAPYFILLIVAVGIIAVGQKDMGQVVVLSGTLMGLLLLSGRSKKFFAIIGLVFVFLFVALIKFAPHRVARFKGWWVGIQDSIPFLPESMKIHDTVVPLHIINSTHAIESGGLLGHGLGAGQYKLGFLSEVHTDFIMAGISEEIGFVGLLLLVSLFMYILYRIFSIGSKLDDLGERFFVYGVGITMFLSFIINAYGISGLIPIKGIAVPLLSYGGSQLIATSLAIGMVLMLSKKVNV